MNNVVTIKILLLSMLLSVVASITLVYVGWLTGLFPVSQHEELLLALSQVAVDEGMSLDRQLLDSEELRMVSLEYQQLSDQYREVRAEIIRLARAGEVVPGDLHDLETDLGFAVKQLGYELLQGQ